MSSGTIIKEHVIKLKYYIWPIIFKRVYIPKKGLNSGTVPSSPILHTNNIGQYVQFSHQNIIIFLNIVNIISQNTKINIARV